MMSDDFTNFPHPDTNADEADALPPNAHALYHCLLDDGAAWRTTPELERVGARLRERVALLTLEQSERSEPVAPSRATAQRPPSSPVHDSAHAMPFRLRALPRRASGWLATVVAVVVVGALAALFVAAGPGRHGAPTCVAPGVNASPTAGKGR
jgi:hypothetical protein